MNIVAPKPPSHCTMAEGKESDDLEVVIDDIGSSDDEEDSDSSDEEPETLQTFKSSRRVPRWLVVASVHALCISIYLLPVLFPTEYNKGRAVLDEMHIVDVENRDVNDPSTPLAVILTNDYWGRPMNSTSSHKSWRPLSVLSFRNLKGGRIFKDLTAHRLFNIVTHAAVAELVGILAVRVWQPDEPDLLRFTAKVLFALHPTHVEVTANAANRPHLLAVLCSTALSDPDLPWWLFLFLLVAGYLVSETFLFQVVPAGVTLSAIVYLRTYHGRRQIARRGRLGQQLGGLVVTVLPRWLLLLGSGVAYYLGRLHMDWLSIPEGLIRPAENPFYEFAGWHRVRNYLYVMAIHVAKAWDVDFVGFSHEYGRECIRPVESWSDTRLWIPLAMVLGYLGMALTLLFRQRRQSVLGIGLIVYIVHVAWMTSLFPISGLVKVGTFIADRIVVASTVSTTLLAAKAAVSWMEMRPRSQRLYRIWVLLGVALLMVLRIFRRTTEWMDSKTLLESSLRTCPRFAKAHLETSKIYSGLYPALHNLTRSRWHLEQAEKFDPDYCDVHQQFGHVAIQENRHLEFEERLTKSLLCPFTMGKQMGMWHQYWNMALGAGNPPAAVAEARERYERYLAAINEAIEKQNERGEEHQSASPLVGWKKR